MNKRKLRGCRFTMNRFRKLVHGLQVLTTNNFVIIVFKMGL
jgi:hypothetical protein